METANRSGETVNCACMCMQDAREARQDEGFYVMKDALTVIINDNQHE